MRDFRTCLKGLRQTFKPLRGRAFTSAAIGLVRIAASLAFVWICKRLVDIATGVIDAPLGPNIAIMIAIMLIQIISGIALTWWDKYINIKSQNEERYSIFSHLLGSRWRGRELFHSADSINRLETDTATVVDLLCSRVPDAFVTLCQLVAASVYLLSMAPDLLWMLVALMCFAVLGSRLFFKTIRKITERIRACESHIQEHMQESLQNRVLVLTLIGTGRVMEKLGLLQKDLEGNYVSRLNYNAAARGFLSLGFTGGYAAAFIWGVLGIRDGSVTYGMMTAFLQLVGQVQRPINDLSRHIPAFIHALTSLERLSDLTDLPEEDESERVLFPTAPEIKVEGVSFTYPDGGFKVLENFSHTFPGGSMTVIMGPTGRGKSTLVRLILALLTPECGSISIGDVKAGTGTRCNFMYVPQGSSLMSGTIRENLLLARSDAGEEEMEAALRTAAADFVLDSLPQGLDTMCSEVGGGLSEGQAQRIAIARALLHEGKVLILDESTSALDAGTEERLLENLKRDLKGEKTILFISHRESVCSCADEILKM